MPTCDLILRGGDVIDGSGGPAFRADVAITDGRITAVGALCEAPAARVIDATGLTVAPGFIDLHSHSDLTILVNPAAESKIHQGVTTEVNGQCGFTPFPVRPGAQTQLDALCPFITAKPEWTWLSTAEYLQTVQAAQPAINVATMAGHSALRAHVMGFDNRPASAAEIAAMCELAGQTLDEGALGISFGLAYALGSFAATEEVEAVTRVAARRGALVSVHIRNEGATLLERLAEMLDLARRVSEEAPLRLEIDHLKASGQRWWGRVDEALAMLEAAVAEGLDVAFDVYPYTAGSRHLSGSLPAWVHDGGQDAMVARLADPDCRAQLRAAHEAWRRGEANVSPLELDFESIVVTDVATDANRWTIGKTLAQIAEERAVDALDAALDLIIAERGHVSVVLFAMSEDDMRKCLAHPLGSVAADGLVFAPYGPLGRGKPHPRAYGTFPRAIGHYARDEGLMTVEEAVRKCTSLPASRLGLTDRGLVREGLRADLVVFDRNTLRDTATYEDPHQYPTGIEHVIVNGS